MAGRGLIGRCPKCGKGALFRGYLKQVEACAACGERYADIRADDGPAWLTILIVGHLVVLLILTVDPEGHLPTWLSTLLWVAVALLATLTLLPRAKGLFIALIWRMGATGGAA